MAWWQLVLLGAFVLVPFALLADFHPRRERLDATGRPLPRAWHTAGSRRAAASRRRPDQLPLG